MSSRSVLARLLVVAFLSIAPITLASAQATTAPNQWTWVDGSVTPPPSGTPFGVYGKLGTPSPDNVPGPRSNAVTITDSQGNFWLFGGEGYDANGTMGDLNDLWEFNPTSQEWTWMGGDAAIPSISSGVYGQKGSPSPLNVPGGRWNAVGWVDHNGNVWIFGGDGFDSKNVYGYLNDLWEFSPSTLEWTWMGGSDVLPAQYEGQPGVYGSLGTPDSGNIPGGRWGASSWTDAQGHFWMFGGEGSPALGGPNQGTTIWSGQLNDLWEYDPASNQWTWVAGSSQLPNNYNYAPNQYGTLGVPAPGNTPGGRYTAASWIDNQGKLWLFGGVAAGADGVGGGAMNDLWEFDPSTMEWTWIGGSNKGCAGACGPTGTYGTLGVTAASNTPGGRYSASTWTDNSGNLWLFAGHGVAAPNNYNEYGTLNDLWSFNTAIQEWTWFGGSTKATQFGTWGTKGFPSPLNIPGSRDSAMSWTDTNGNLWFFGGLGGNIAELSWLNDLWEYQPPPQVSAPVFTPTPAPSTSPQMVTITDATPNATIYFTVDGTTPTTSSIPYSNSFQVSQTVTLKAVAVATGYTPSSLATATYTIQAVPVLSWPAPATIAYGIPLSQTQLNATANVPGTFTYSPAAGTILGLGSHTLNVTFTPSDSTDYTTATSSVTLTVTAATPTISWAAPAAIPYGTALTSSQLNATASVPGTFVYSPAAGTVLGLGSHTLNVTFTPTDSTDYTTTTASVILTVNQATPTVTWAAPAAIPYGAALSATQLNATASVAGTFAYSPAAGTVLGAGSQTLSTTFTPTDSTDYATASDSVTLTVNPIAPAIALTSSANPSTVAQSVTFTAAVTSPAGTPTGSVTFWDGATQVGSGTLAAGMATYATSNLTVGSHTINAQYSGDSNFTSVTSTALTQTVSPLSIGPAPGAPTSANIAPGGTANFVLSVTPPGNSPVNLSVAGLPAGATSSFGPNPVPAGAGPTNVQLVINLPGQASSAAPQKTPFTRMPLALGVLVLPLLGLRRVRRGSRFLLIAILAIAGAAVAAGLSGCSGHNFNNGPTQTQTPQGAYTLTVTATAGTATQTTTLTLNVQ